MHFKKMKIAFLAFVLGASLLDRWKDGPKLYEGANAISRALLWVICTYRNYLVFDVRRIFSLKVYT